MRTRVTNKDLEYYVDRLNTVTGHEKSAWTNGKANIGTYYIDGAYGGVKLVQIQNEHGGIRTISNNGYGTKRELLDFLGAYLSGIELQA